MHMLYNSINIAVSMLIGGILMAYNVVGKAATNKYRARFDMIQIRVEQGERDKIYKHARNQGESMNAFINRAIKTVMEQDNDRSKYEE